VEWVTQSFAHVFTSDFDFSDKEDIATQHAISCAVSMQDFPDKLLVMLLNARHEEDYKKGLFLILTKKPVSKSVNARIPVHTLMVNL